MADDLDVLEEYGIPVRKLANMIRNVRALAGSALEELGKAIKPRRGRPPAAAGAASTGAGKRKRGRVRGWNPSREELHKWKSEGMTARAIAQKAGVSMGTVNLRLKQHGLTGKRGRPAKKK